MRGCSPETCCGRWRHVEVMYGAGLREEAVIEAERLIREEGIPVCTTAARVLRLMRTEGQIGATHDRT